MTNWDLIKTQFEMLGKSEEDLCNEHSINPTVLKSAIKSQSWERYVATPAPYGSQPGDLDTDAAIEALTTAAALKHAKHQSILIPKYIEIETTFLSRLKERAGMFDTADEAKKIAETLAMIKPDVMKQAENKQADGNQGGLKILIQNKFPTPVPGELGYVAPNAVIVGEAAGKGTLRRAEVVGAEQEAEYMQIEMDDYPETEVIN